MACSCTKFTTQQVNTSKKKDYKYKKKSKNKFYTGSTPQPTPFTK